jgi:phosphoserine phosphatase
MAHGKAVYVVTSGLFQAVAEFVSILGLVPAQLHAVEVHLDAAGAYQGFNTGSPLCRSDGKAIVCRRIAATHGNVAIVGDGMTDLAARAGGAYVVGYGGVINRDIMRQGADCYVAAPSLIAILPALLTSEESRSDCGA